jgi:C_GCAxxG_C_C family probable redox protein
MQAQALFESGFLCSQAILISFADQYNLNPDLAARLAAPFGGGIARRGETCGAVIGALLVTGLKWGHQTAEDVDSKEKTYLMVEMFISEFEDRNKTIICRELIGYDISSPQGLQSAYEAGIFETQCPKFVNDAQEILDQLFTLNGDSASP